MLNATQQYSLAYEYVFISQCNRMRKLTNTYS